MATSELPHICQVDAVGRSYRGVCACQTRGPIVATPKEAEDWNKEHRSIVLRNRLRLTPQPTLKRWAMLCREASENPDYTDEARRQWAAEAGAVERRLHPPGPEQQQLF